MSPIPSHPIPSRRACVCAPLTPALSSHAHTLARSHAHRAPAYLAKELEADAKRTRAAAFDLLDYAHAFPFLCAPEAYTGSDERWAPPINIWAVGHLVRARFAFAEVFCLLSCAWG